MRAASVADKGMMAMDLHRGEVGGREADSQPRKGLLRRFDKKSKPDLIEEKTQKLERDAYKAVLRAFQAQANHITWEKERIMTDLRKELRVTDEQHRDFLALLSKDDLLQQLRDMRGNGPYYDEPPPKRQKRGPGRPPGRKSGKANGNDIGVGGAGVLKKLGDSKPKAVKAPTCGNVKVDDEFQLLSLEEIESQMAEIIGAEAELARILLFKKCAQIHETRLIEELAKLGFDENGDVKIDAADVKIEESAADEQIDSQGAAAVKDEG